MHGARRGNANGTELSHHGAEEIKFVHAEGLEKTGEKMSNVCAKRFHGADTKKPLAAAMAISNLGEGIALEGGESRSHVDIIKIDGRVASRESGGACVFDDELPKDTLRCVSAGWDHEGPRMGAVESEREAEKHMH